MSKTKGRYKGREVFIETKDLPLITIEIKLKPGECPKNLPPERMGPESCRGDCQNTYLSFMYDSHQGKVFFEGALIRNGTCLFQDGLERTGLEYSLAEQMIKTRHKDLTYQQEGARTVILYHGEAIGARSGCGYEFGERIFSTNPEQRDFQTEVRSRPKAFMEQCGLKLIDSRDPKDMKELETILRAQKHTY